MFLFFSKFLQFFVGKNEYLKLLHFKFWNVLKFRDEFKFSKNLSAFKKVKAMW